MTFSLSDWHYPRYIAHRGGGKLAPENTLAAMRKGAELGYRMAEFDVKFSQDRVLFLLHDDGVDRTTTATGLATQFDFASLMQLDAGSRHSALYAGEPPASFEATARFARANGVACNVEIKSNPGEEYETGVAVAQACRQWWQGADMPPLLSSFDEASLEAALKTAPELPRGLLVESIPADWKARMERLQCISLNINHKDATEALIGEVHAAGYKITAWTINDPVRAKQLLDWGIDAIFTDALDKIDPKA